MTWDAAILLCNVKQRQQDVMHWLHVAGTQAQVLLVHHAAPSFGAHSFHDTVQLHLDADKNLVLIKSEPTLCMSHTGVKL